MCVSCYGCVKTVARCWFSHIPLCRKMLSVMCEHNDNISPWSRSITVTYRLLQTDNWLIIYLKIIVGLSIMDKVLMSLIRWLTWAARWQRVAERADMTIAVYCSSTVVTVAVNDAWRVVTNASVFDEDHYRLWAEVCWLNDELWHMTAQSCILCLLYALNIDCQCTWSHRCAAVNQATEMHTVISVVHLSAAA